jgi:NitT/TauT family transport system permease protein
MKALLQQINKKLQAVYLIALFFIVWQVVPSLGLVNTNYFPALSTVLSRGFEVGLAQIGSDVGHSLLRIVLGFAIATVTALPLGFILSGALPRLGKFLGPLTTFLSQIPPFILLPVFVLVLGVGEQSIVAVIFWSAFWPILFACIRGISLTDPLLIKSARSMGAGPLTIFAKVVIPNAVPSIMTGMRYALTFSFMMLIAAESMGSFAGMGYELTLAQRRAQIPIIYFMVIVIAVVGLLVNYLFELFEKKVTAWKQDGAEGVA